MTAGHAPPTRLIRFLCIAIVVAVFASTGKQHWGRAGLYVGVFVGLLAGWLAGWWVKRTFLDY